MSMRCVCGATGLIVAALLLAGCAGGKALPKTAAVKGKALDQKGNPLTAGSVRFESKTAGDLTVSSAIGTDGSFDLETFRNNDRQKGAPPGEYAVIIQRAITQGNQPPDPVTLPVAVTIPAEGNSDLTLRLPANVK